MPTLIVTLLFLPWKPGVSLSHFAVAVFVMRMLPLPLEPFFMFLAFAAVVETAFAPSTTNSKMTALALDLSLVLADKVLRLQVIVPFASEHSACQYSLKNFKH